MWCVQLKRHLIGIFMRLIFVGLTNLRLQARRQAEAAARPSAPPAPDSSTHSATKAKPFVQDNQSNRRLGAYSKGKSDRRGPANRAGTGALTFNALDHKEADLQSQMDNHTTKTLLQQSFRGRINRMALRALYLIGEECSTKFVRGGGW